MGGCEGAIEVEEHGEICRRYERGLNGFVIPEQSTFKYSIILRMTFITRRHIPFVVDAWLLPFIILSKYLSDSVCHCERLPPS